MFCAVQPCNTSSTVGAGSVASCLTPAASVFCTLLARQSVCTGGQRGDLSEMTAAGGAGAKERVLNGLFRSDSLQSPLCAGRSGNRAAQITITHSTYAGLDSVRGVTVGAQMATGLAYIVTLLTLIKQ